MSYKAAMIGDVFYLRWLTPESADVDRILREVVPSAKKGNGRLIYVAVSPEDSPPPDQDTRKDLVTLAEQLVKRCDGVHLVFEAKGFKAAIKRNVMTGILLASRKLAGIKVHKSREEFFAAVADSVDVSSLQEQVSKLGLDH